jgi:hypothetical protein
VPDVGRLYVSQRLGQVGSKRVRAARFGGAANDLRAPHGENTTDTGRCYRLRGSVESWRRAGLLGLTMRIDASPTTPRRSPRWASERRRLREDGLPPHQLKRMVACFPFPFPHDPIGGKREAAAWVRGWADNLRRIA